MPFPPDPPALRGIRYFRAVPAMLAVVAMLALALVPLATTAQSSRSVVWDTYNVTLDVRKDGTLHVTEYQLITFNGVFSQGFANIPLGHVENIDNLTVAVANDATSTPVDYSYVRRNFYSEDEGTYTYSTSAGTLAVDYSFPSTSNSSNDQRVVVLEYDVEGAIRDYPDLTPANQQLWWYAITSDTTDVADIKDSTVTITLPEVVNQSDIVAYPENPTVDGASYSWHKTNLKDGAEFEVSLQFPRITAATAPSWQAADDRARQAAQDAKERSDWAGVLMLVAGLIGSIAFGVLGLATWFTKGRDPHVGLVAEYIPDPPDDLRPGAVGVLVDEQFDSRDVVATVLDLARRGVIKMNTVEGKNMASSYEFEAVAHKETLEPYENDVMSVIFGTPKPEVGTKRRMPEVAGSLASANSRIADGFYKELVSHKYFNDEPDDTRKRWKAIFTIAPVLLIGSVVVIIFAVGAWSNFAFLPIIAAFVLLMFSGRLAAAMPQKTLAGAESAAKWRAFRAYLKDIDKREDLAKRNEVFEKHLPYAVAFGLAQEWEARFAHYAIPTPAYYGGSGPLTRRGRTIIIGNDFGGYGRNSNRGGNWTTMPGQGGDSGGGGWDMPTLQEGSDKGAKTLQSGSDSFFGMLGTVAKAFAESSGSGSFGSSRGGGFSGGGSRGGGSHGGGGGGGGGRGFR